MELDEQPIIYLVLDETLLTPGLRVGYKDEYRVPLGGS